ncbi:MAG: Hsp20/alpha crystallin family protein [Halorientalis sp.]
MRTSDAQSAPRRVVRLPEPVDEEHVSASYDGGVLRVTLKRRQHSRRVEIEWARSATGSPP